MTDKNLNFDVTCITPKGITKVLPYHKVLDVMIEQNNSAAKIMALFESCDRIRAGELVDGADCEMVGYSFKRV